MNDVEKELFDNFSRKDLAILLGWVSPPAYNRGHLPGYASGLTKRKLAKALVLKWKVAGSQAIEITTVKTKKG